MSECGACKREMNDDELAILGQGENVGRVCRDGRACYTEFVKNDENREPTEEELRAADNISRITNAAADGLIPPELALMMLSG